MESKRLAIIALISATLALPLGGFVFGFMHCDDCGFNILGRGFVGLVFAVLAPLSGGFPPPERRWRWRPVQRVAAHRGYVGAIGGLPSLPGKEKGPKQRADPVSHRPTPLILRSSIITATLNMAQYFIRLRRAYGGQERDGSPARRRG